MHMTVCHFSTCVTFHLSKFVTFIVGKPSDLFDVTNPDWAPTLKLGHNEAPTDFSRHHRLACRKEKDRSRQAAASLLELQELRVEETEDIDGNVAVQTDLTSKTVQAMQEDIQRLLSENSELKLKLSRAEYNEAFFKTDDNVKYYTGLPDFSTLQILYSHIEEHLSAANKITKFQQLVLCLMRLRLNVSHMDLAHKFGTTSSTSSRIFLNVLDVLYSRISPLIVWPDREQLRESMPMCFRVHFKDKVAVIVDCFEVFTDRPSNLAARAQTWSSYKHNNTAKFLIGITPQGSISFISRGYGGRVSDKYVMEHCGILRKLLPGDVVLADRGFDIADSVAMTGAQLHIPAFTKGKTQLSAKEVESTRRIANVRIHVERVIGSLKQKYTVLQSTVPIEYLISVDKKPCTVDKIATVCCALTNLCPPIVPFE